MNWKNIRILTLTILILLSLFLSWSMWTAGGSFGENQMITRITTPSVTFTRSEEDVFGPTQIVIHDSEGKRSSINDSELDNIKPDWTITSVEDPIQVSNEAYQEVMNRTPGLEFIFEGQIPFGMYETTFNILPGEYENRTFNRGFIPFNNLLKMYFYNSNAQVLYETEIEGITQQDINSLAYNEDKTYFSVDAIQLKDQHVYLPSEPLEMAYQDYLIERLPNSLFVNSFFPETSEVDVRRNDNIIRYLDYVSELRINENNQLLTYRKQQTSNTNKMLNEQLSDSFNSLTQFEKWTEEIHYQDYNPDTRTVTFRRYLDGLPVFGYYDNGEVQIRTTNDELTYLRIPLEVVQTPIAQTDEEELVVLESGQEIIDQLAATGTDFNEIENIKVGLSWEHNEESSQVVRFVPKWYILEKGNWLEMDRYVTYRTGELHNGF